MRMDMVSCLRVHLMQIKKIWLQRTCLKVTSQHSKLQSVGQSVKTPIRVKTLL
jgi:hypothetical protein